MKTTAFLAAMLLAVPALAAEPVVLDDKALDQVTAGYSYTLPDPLPVLSFRFGPCGGPCQFVFSSN